MSNSIPYISSDIVFNKEFLNRYIYPDMDKTYYWIDDFSPHIYIELAKGGFISTSTYYDGIGNILLPEIQEAYAVLDFKNLHIGKKVKKLFKSNYELITSKELDIVIPLLSSYHGEESWLTGDYIDLMYRLNKYNLKDNNFELLTTLLYSDNEPVSGEVGYFIGRTYTSLTGFSNRDYNNWGTFQLVLLSKYLEGRGLDFWNLGHPYMEYKKRLGAKILKRDEFLSRWLKSAVNLF